MKQQFMDSTLSEYIMETPLNKNHLTCSRSIKKASVAASVGAEIRNLRDNTILVSEVRSFRHLGLKQGPCGLL
jgi:hypothetical protein